LRNLRYHSLVLGVGSSIFTRGPTDVGHDGLEGFCDVVGGFHNGLLLHFGTEGGSFAQGHDAAGILQVLHTDKESSLSLSTLVVGVTNELSVTTTTDANRTQFTIS
jgi:hypothetical protein